MAFLRIIVAILVQSTLSRGLRQSSARTLAGHPVVGTPLPITSHTGNDIGLSLTVDTISGTWSIDDIWSQVSDVL
jgi:hypothetical protein